MTQRYSTAIWIDLGHVRADFFGPRQNHRSERLVDLEYVDVINAQSGLVEHFLGRRNRSFEHDDRIAAD